MRRLIHDLNNALSVVTINVGLLAAGVTDEGESRELLAESAAAAANASRLSSQLRRCVSESSDVFETERADAARPPAANAG